MHKSCLGAVIIDCRTDDIEAAAAFWGAAFGYATQPTEDPNYIDLDVPMGLPKVVVQKVTHESRVHLDVETDDIEAEVARLEKLGAKRVGDVKRWVVMEAPTGQRFCVVRPQRSDFQERASVREG
ncbi:MAG: VOC family protein [Geminicoccaceae bacterium]